MKTKGKLLAAALVATVLWYGTPNTCYARDKYEHDAGAVAADVLVYRPAGIILTVGGSALFVLALPFSAIAGGTKHAAKTLVQTPWNLTFHRPVGTNMKEYVDDEWSWYY